MAFVMIATGASSRSPVRTLSMRPLVGAAVLGALGLLAAGGGLGYAVAEAQVVQVPVVAGPSAPQPAHPFTLEQLGALSGRLFRLESEAAQLGKRIGVLQKEPSAASTGAAPRREPVRQEATTDTMAPVGASGGPWLPARPAASLDLDALDAQLMRIEEKIASIADATVRRSLELMRLPTRLPIPGAGLTSSFGNRIDPFAHSRAFHAGLDFAAAHGTPITAAAGGKVVFAGWKNDYGWTVEINHGNGLATRYAHASRLLVGIGRVVVPGDRIALVGSTGRSSGAHLHFEVLRNGGQVDPKRYLAGI
ncbi:MAG TPA: M23 family metallopeptidase [Caldimonas sp.]|jgi:murein DD-endopeptidase MepM/ murein hydrolase activator NlpD|nr:M23 family metallopeptidase [Caldimonas sp.]HEX2541299.1 M23 family metallopeptidase [Caldimonas sp.]